jgi:hypothetical protein
MRLEKVSNGETLLAAAPPSTHPSTIIFSFSVFDNVLAFIQSNLWSSKSIQLSRIKLRPDLLDYLGSLLDDEGNGFHYQEIGERVFDMENADVATRCLAAGGQQGKIVIRMKPFSKLCPVKTHIHCT